MNFTEYYAFTKKDIINANSNSIPLQTAPEKIEAKGFAIAENVPDRDGEIKTVGYITAVDGTTRPDNCKFTVAVDEIALLEAIEIIPCTEKAEASIKAVAVWKR